MSHVVKINMNKFSQLRNILNFDFRYQSLSSRILTIRSIFTRTYQLYQGCLDCHWWTVDLRFLQVLEALLLLEHTAFHLHLCYLPVLEVLVHLPALLVLFHL